MHMFAREMPGIEYGEGAREGWDTEVHGVAKLWTQLSD